MRHSLRFLILIVLISIISGCGKSKSSGHLLCYTSVPLGIMTEIKKDFEAKNPQIKINVEAATSEETVETTDVYLKVYREGSGHVIAKLAAEQETGGGIKADLLWIAEPSYYYYLKDRNSLLNYESKWNAEIPAMFKDQDMAFWGARVFVMVIIYNSKNVDDPPKTWQDLTNPKWKGEIAIANPSYSGASLLFVGSLAKKYSWDYFRELRANDVAVVKGNSVVAAKVATGEFDVGVTIHNIALDMKKSGSAIEVVYPSDGAVMVTSPIAIFRDSDKTELAQIFMDYVLSADGQKILVEKGNFIPVRGDVDPPADTPTRDELLETAFDLSWLEDSDHVTAIKEQFQRVVLFD